MLERILITGVAGFVGSHLADFLVQKDGVEVYGIDLPNIQIDNIEHLRRKFRFIECDILNKITINEVIQEVKPTRIFHLAAQTFVPAAWRDPAETFRINIFGQLNLFEAVKDVGVNPLILVAGSSEEYGLVNQNELPIKETAPLRPMNPYAVSKVTQDMLAYQYSRSPGLKIIRTRAFNHTGPRQSERFVCPGFAKQMAMIEVGQQEPVMYVGNLDAERDFTDVRDVVRAYWLVLEKGKIGEVYNVCSGTAYSIKQVLEILLSLSKADIEVRQDLEKMRPSDVPLFVGDNTKLKSETSWKPKISFENTLADILECWRSKLP